MRKLLLSRRSEPLALPSVVHYNAEQRTHLALKSTGLRTHFKWKWGQKYQVACIASALYCKSICCSYARTLSALPHAIDACVIHQVRVCYYVTQPGTEESQE
eukprot:1158040-Pelagomonas_calceolata.AAC.3